MAIYCPNTSIFYLLLYNLYYIILCYILHCIPVILFQGGSFTISNLGMYGIKHFSAVINPPQVC